MTMLEELATAPRPQILMGIGKINGDGWKDTTKVGQIVFVWNDPLPPPYAEGQYPRVGNEGWAASTEQFEFHSADISEVRELFTREIDRAKAEGWRPIETAPKDGTYILAVVASDRGRHLQYHAGRMFVIRHEGVTDGGGYDLGWAVYPGFGGASDHDFTHWMPLPSPPSIEG